MNLDEAVTGLQNLIDRYPSVSDLRERDDLKREIFTARSQLWSSLLDSHNGNEDAATDDHRYDSVFDAAKEIIERKSEDTGRRLHTIRRGRIAEDNAMIRNP